MVLVVFVSTLLLRMILSISTKGRARHRFIIFIPLSADVNSWLVTFGFQLYNVIPGYRKPNTEAMEPSYELVSTQIKTQEWDSTKVKQRLLFIPLFTPRQITLFTPPCLVLSNIISK